MLSAYSTSQRLCRKDHNQMDRPLPLCNHNLLHFPDLKRHPHNVSHNICNLHKFPLRKSHSYILSVLRSHPHTDNRQNSVQPEIWMHLLQTYLPFFRMGLPVRSECMEWPRLRCRKALLWHSRNLLPNQALMQRWNWLQESHYQSCHLNKK